MKAKWSPFRKIRVWALYDPAAREITSFHKFKYQVPIPRPGSSLRVVELTGFYPASPSVDDICKCGHLRGEHFRRVCTMVVDEGEKPCECNRFHLDSQASRGE